MLHLIFQSPVDRAILERIAAGDDVVFVENATLGLLRNGGLAATLIGLQAASRLFVLADDIAARGLSVEELVSGIDVIDYQALVALTIKNPVIQSWA